MSICRYVSYVCFAVGLLHSFCLHFADNNRRLRVETRQLWPRGTSVQAIRLLARSLSRLLYCGGRGCLKNWKRFWSARSLVLLSKFKKCKKLIKIMMEKAAAARKEITFQYLLVQTWIYICTYVCTYIA